jgi:tripartite-type tricarboxylate transporter receptor subunit TctC
LWGAIAHHGGVPENFSLRQFIQKEKTMNPIQVWVRALGFAVLALMLCSAQAGDFPSRPIRVVVAQAAGTVMDVRMRLITERLGKAFGQPVIVENKPGAAGTLAVDFVAKSPADGHTLLYGSISDQAVAPVVYAKLPYDPETALIPVTLANMGYPLLLVSATSNIHSLKDLIAEAKAKPGMLTFATAGNGDYSHLLQALFNEVAGISMVPVAYKNPPQALLDVASGQVQATWGFLVTSEGFIKSGKVRALMVLSDRRLPMLADVPTSAELGMNKLNHLGWAGVLAPGGTPAAIVKRLNEEFRKAFESPEFRARVEATGGIVKTNTPEEFAAFIRQERESMARIVRANGITLN